MTNILDSKFTLWFDIKKEDSYENNLTQIAEINTIEVSIKKKKNYIHICIFLFLFELRYLLGKKLKKIN